MDNTIFIFRGPKIWIIITFSLTHPLTPSLFARFLANREGFREDLGGFRVDLNEGSRDKTM
jgi:hypothetical protein